MNTSPLVEVFATPLRDRLRQLSERAELVHGTQTELRAAATAVVEQREQLRAPSATVAEHWHGSAAERFGHENAAAAGALTAAAEAIAAADVLVTEATNSIHTGRASIRRLLDEYTSGGNQVITAAMRLLDAGHPTALLDAAGYLSDLADKYTAEADSAVRTVREVLVAVTGEFAVLDKHLPAPDHPKQAEPEHHHPTVSGGTTVHIGHGLGTSTAPNAAAATAVRAALSQLGVPYVWGGESPGHAFDCSGLTAWAYGRAGISLPHFASSQRIGQQVPEKDLEPGDLVVFSGHVTMYVGKGHVVSAPHTGADVRIEPLFTSIPGDPFLGFYRPSVRA
jgi:cell wall-associated NlpC family hydrolase